MRLREEQAKLLRSGRVLPQGIFALGRDDALLYLTTFAIVGLGIWGVTFAVESNLLGIFLLGGALLGFLSSLHARQSKSPFVTALLPLAGLLGIIFLLRLAGWEIASVIIPTSPEMTSPELSAISSLGLVLILSTFVLINREMLSFCIVPVIAIFGLLGYFIDPRVIIAFLVFLLASIFLLVFEHTVTLREEEGLRLGGAETRQLPQNQLLVASGFFLTVLVVGFTLTVVLVGLLSRQRLAGVVEAISRAVQLNPNLTPTNPSSALQSAPDNFRVGQGPLNLGQRVVMSVKADTPGLWRQRVYDAYNGSGWNIGEGNLSHRVRLENGQARMEPSGPAGKSNTQIFHLNTSFLEGLPAEAQPIEIAFKNSKPLQVVVDRFGCLEKTDLALPKGTTYQVISATTSLADPPQTERLSLRRRESGIYLQVPWGARKVKPLVESLVKRADTPEKKIAALIGYLQSDRYSYSLQAPAVPAGEDAVDFFLFRSRVGYCDLFASAFAVMCRAANIPSRMAVGFASGDPDPTTGDYVVKEADGHAWVEVFLENRGWVTVDPTPAGAAQAERERLNAPVPAWKRTLRRIRIPLIFASLVAVVLGALLKVLFFDPWWEQSRWEKRMVGSREGKIAVFYARMLRLLGNRGILRQPWQTPLEYLAALTGAQNRWPQAVAPAEELTQLFIAARYHRREVVEAQVQQAQQAWLRLQQALKPRSSKPVR